MIKLYVRIYDHGGLYSITVYETSKEPWSNCLLMLHKWERINVTEDKAVNRGARTIEICKLDDLRSVAFLRVRNVVGNV